MSGATPRGVIIAPETSIILDASGPPMLTPHMLVCFLNSLCALDPHAMRVLFDFRAWCGKALADHPTVIVGDVDAHAAGYPSGTDVGFLGILNGLLAELGRIARVDDSAGNLLCFRLLTPEEVERVDRKAPGLTEAVAAAVEAYKDRKASEEAERAHARRRAWASSWPWTEFPAETPPGGKGS